MTLDRLRGWALRLKRDTIALWLAARDPRTPLLAKLIAGTVAAYAFSPIDLIPDIIPVFGLLDDLLIVPAGLWLALRLIPPPLIAEFRAEAAEHAERPVNRSAAVVVIAIWIAIAAIALAIALP